MSYTGLQFPTGMLPTPYDDEIQALRESLFGVKDNKEGLAEFLLKASPDLSVPDHLKPLIKVLEDSLDKPQKVCLSMPPQHGKSTTIKHAIVYSVKRKPERTNAYVTYADELTRDQAIDMRRLCEVAGIHCTGRITHRKTPQGGGIIATSVGGSLTGKKVDGMLVIDDPFKGREDSESPTMRKRVWDFFTTVARSRRHKTTSTIIVHTRWHQDDLIGRIEKDLQKEGWVFINLPAIGEDGTALWPEGHSLASLEEERQALGPYDFEALYQGNPRPRGNTLFIEPARFVLPDPSESNYSERMATFLHGKTLILSVDPAATKKTSADHSVILTLATEGRGKNMRGWIIDVKRVQTTVPEVVDLIIETRKRYNCRVAVEAVGGFKAVPQMLERIDPTLKVGKTIKEIHPTTDKFQRAQPVAAAWNDERILVPSNTPWAEPFVDEVLAFTGLGDRFDDQVDALSHGWNTLAGMKGVFRGVKRSYRTLG